MKVNKNSAFNSLSLLILLLLCFSCRKSTINKISTSPIHTVDTSHSLPGPPVVFGGNDMTIQLPTNYITLSGSYTQPNNLGRVEWEKLKGPACLIENPKSLTTKVRGLQAETYQFELTVYDTLNFYVKDTVIVSVLPFSGVDSSHYTIFNNISWIFPWYNSLEINNIYSHVPPDKALKVFIQRAFSTNWVEAYPVSDNPTNNVYEYFIEKRLYGAGMYNYGSLYVFYYGENTSDTPNVRVEY